MADFTLYIGRSAVLPFYPSAELPSGVSFVFTAKTSRSATENAITSTNITFDTASNTGKITLLDADTDPLLAREYVCDVQAIVDNDQNFVIASGTFAAINPVRIS